MLDLQKRKKKTFDVLLPGGEELHIKKANDDLLYSMEDFEKKVRSLNGVKEVFEEVKKLILQILNRNTDGKIFDGLLFNMEDEEGDNIYDYSTCMLIFQEYSKFMQEVLSNPN